MSNSAFPTTCVNCRELCLNCLWECIGSSSFRSMPEAAQAATGRQRLATSLNSNHATGQEEQEAADEKWHLGRQHLQKTLSIYLSIYLCIYLLTYVFIYLFTYLFIFICLTWTRHHREGLLVHMWHLRTRRKKTLPGLADEAGRGDLRERALEMKAVQWSWSIAIVYNWANSSTHEDRLVIACLFIALSTLFA